MRSSLGAGLLGVLACTSCFDFHDSFPCDDFTIGVVTNDVPVLLAGDPIGFVVIVTEATPANCNVQEVIAPSWEIAVAPEGALFTLVPDVEPIFATVRAETAGKYRVRARLETKSADLDFEVRALEDAPAVTPELRFLEGECTDVEAHGERLLCVHLGVSVLSATTGAELGSTDEPVPSTYGVASNGASFATAAYGCGNTEGVQIPCPDPGDVVAGGARIYTIDAAGRPELRASLPLGRADEVALTADRLYVTHEPGRVTAFDVTNPGAPRELGCTELLDPMPATGVPVLAGSRLYVLTNRELVAYAIDQLERTCAAPAGIVAHTPLKSGLVGHKALYATETEAHAITATAIHTFRLEGSAFTAVDAVRLDQTAASTRIGDTIYVLQRHRLLAIELLGQGRIGAIRLLRDDLADLEPTAMTTREGALLLVAKSTPSR